MTTSTIFRKTALTGMIFVHYYCHGFRQLCSARSLALKEIQCSCELLHQKKCTKISLIFVWTSPVDEVEISVEPSLDEMQRTAIDLKFSRRGEMFTAKNLADLINKCFSHYQVRNNPYNTLPLRKMNYHTSLRLKKATLLFLDIVHHSWNKRFCVH